MFKRELLLKVLFFLALLFIAAFIYVVSVQPFYQLGLDLNLGEEGYVVNRVAPDSPAQAAGIRSDMLITRIDTLDTRLLNRLSTEAVQHYIRIAGSLFSYGEPVRLACSNGLTVVLKPDLARFGNRLYVSNSTVLLNAVFASIIVLIGLFFLYAGEDHARLHLYGLFVLFLSLAILVSFFHTLWSLPLVRLRYLLLDLFGVSAAVCMLILSSQFPNRILRHTGRVTFLLYLPLCMKYLLLLSGKIELYDSSSYFVHLYVVVAIFSSILLFLIQYRSCNSGQKRSLRWVFVGMVLTLLPYFFYLINLIGSGNYISSSFLSQLVNHLANASLLAFPLFLGIGITAKNPFDVDRILSWLIMFIAVFVQQLVIVLLIRTFLDSPPRILVYVMLIVMNSIMIPTIFHLTRSRLGMIVYRQDRIVAQTLKGLGDYLSRPHKKEEIRKEVTLVFNRLFSPSFVRYVDQALDELELRKRGELALPFHSVREKRGYILFGPRTDGDIYTRQNLDRLSSLCYEIRQALENSDLYTDLSRSVASLKKVENSLRRELSEKEVLLREVHHRVKNNLNVISSLLNMQSQQINAPEDAVKALKTNHDRIYAMALLHDMLCRHSLLRFIPMHDYIASLVSSLYTSYGGGKVMEIDVEKVTDYKFPITLAMPLGLILNELVRNVFVHAFADQDQGRLSISLHEYQGAYRLQVADSGHLLSERVDFNRPGQFGLELSQMLSEQMGGTIHGYGGESGGLFVIDFPM